MSRRLSGELKRVKGRFVSRDEIKTRENELIRT